MFGIADVRQTFHDPQDLVGRLAYGGSHGKPVHLEHHAKLDHGLSCGMTGFLYRRDDLRYPRFEALSRVMESYSILTYVD